MRGRADKRHTLAIRWLVLRHFCGKNYTEIARGHAVDRKAVSTAVKAIAHYFRITLVPADRGGRPRGSGTRQRLLRVTRN